MMAMQAAARMIPWITDRTTPWVAARRASSSFPAPLAVAIRALIPTPKPMAMALMKFWIGNTRDSASMAFSLIWATK